MRHENELQEQKLMVSLVICLLKAKIQLIHPSSVTHPSDSLALTGSPLLSATASNGLQNTKSSNLAPHNQEYQRSKFPLLDHTLNVVPTLQVSISILEAIFWGLSCWRL